MRENKEIMLTRSTNKIISNMLNKGYMINEIKDCLEVDTKRILRIIYDMSKRTYFPLYGDLYIKNKCLIAEYICGVYYDYEIMRKHNKPYHEFYEIINNTINSNDYIEHRKMISNYMMNKKLNNKNNLIVDKFKKSIKYKNRCSVDKEYIPTGIDVYNDNRKINKSKNSISQTDKDYIIHAFRYKNLSLKEISKDKDISVYYIRKILSTEFSEKILRNIFWRNSCIRRSKKKILNLYKSNMNIIDILSKTDFNYKYIESVINNYEEETN